MVVGRNARKYEGQPYTAIDDKLVNKASRYRPLKTRR